MDPVLITGAAGFIGSHLAERLLAGGQRVLGLDDFNDFYDPARKRRQIRPALESADFDLVEGDIRDEALLEAVFEQYRPVGVIHLAARAGVQPSLAQPGLYVDVNLNGTVRLLEACRRHGVSRFTFASSSSVYGESGTPPFREDQPVDHPISPYAATKKAGELICHSFHHAFGLDIACLRFFTVYGPRQRPDMAIQRFLEAALTGRAVTLYGDGGHRRDFTYIDDIIDGIVLAHRLSKGYRVYNLGEERTISMQELIECIEALTGKRIDVRREAARAGDMRLTHADISRAKAELGYRPGVDLETGLSRQLAWLEGELVGTSA